MKVIAAILARVDSPPAPDHLLTHRALAVIKGRPVLAWIADRLQKCQTLNGIIIAVGDENRDAPILALARKLDLPIISGHPDSILNRLHLVAQREQADFVVRINGNFPLVEPGALDELVAAHLRTRADLSLNSHYHGLIHGLGVEIFSRATLERVAQSDLTPEQRNSGTLYLLHRPDQYRIHRQPAERTAPHLRVSVDFQTDLEAITAILDEEPNPDQGWIIDFLGTRPDLVAAQQFNTPAEVSLEKAMLFPEKMLALNRNNCLTYDHTYPISVELSLTNACNHHCLWCSDAGLRRRLAGRLDLDILGPLFRDLATGGTRGVVIEGGGEPTTHPNFGQVVQAVREQGLALGLITNGFLRPAVPTEAFEWIRVSLDAASRDQYRVLKGVDGFDQVIGHLMTLAAEKGRATLGVGYVLTNMNDDPVLLEQLVQFLRQIGVGYIHFRPVVDHPKLTSQADLGYLKKYETQDFSVNIAPLAENRASGNLGLPCLAHSLSTVIAADGGVYLCGRLNTNSSWEPLGNLREQSFCQIWTGDKRRAQVGLVSQARFCQIHCPQCRMTKYNRLLNDVARIKTRNFI